MADPATEVERLLFSIISDLRSCTGEFQGKGEGEMAQIILDEFESRIEQRFGGDASRAFARIRRGILEID